MSPDPKRMIVDTDAPAGYETEEVSAAKEIALEVVSEAMEAVCDFGDMDAHPEGYPEGSDPIHVAGVIVTALIDAGWRPTTTVPVSDDLGEAIERAQRGLDQGALADALRSARDERIRAEDAVELRKRLDPALREKWCWGNRCPDTDWGGKGRRHLRGKTCTPPDDSPLTALTDPRLRAPKEG